VKFDGSSNGEANLDLKVARNEVAKGIVHKYVVMVRQNARRVSVSYRN
jgi:large subunit ribosomal protein L4